ncbi:Small RNA degrading nuclease 5 [Astathelohania contejeani]|uniref:Small RNA degrading nuclease 5 n=1 Tax=Astathelohania contejeani TaxID=164912 RepID=A0ABQ7I008_9MICR|nr:Small RNA degrading nuclease 5 [Thelohania contejeani]
MKKEIQVDGPLIKITESKLKSLNLVTIQNLILWLYSKGKKPSFIGIHNKDLIKSTNLIFLNENRDLEKQLINRFGLKCSGSLQERLTPRLFMNYVTKCVVSGARTPNLSVIKKENLKEFRIKNPNSIYKENTMLVESQMDIGIPNGYFRLIGESQHEIVAIDCEMVLTTKGVELGRVSIIDNCGKTIYDKLVRPSYEVIDYCTRYSGLDESVHNGITYEQMVQEITDLLGANTIIVGHSLYNDLTALKLYHTKLIDTSHIYRTKDNYKISLKALAKSYLKKSIQCKTHCSVEDSLTCLELLSLKVVEMLERKSSQTPSFTNYGITVNIRNSVDDLTSLVGTRAVNLFEVKAVDLFESDITLCDYRDSLFIFIYGIENKLYFLM